MNDTEINSTGDLAGQLAALQRQVFTLLMALIVVSSTLVAYLGYESHHLGKDIAVTGKAYANGQGGGAAAVLPKRLLTNLSSKPFGIAFDKARSRLYVSFPSEHLSAPMR